MFSELTFWDKQQRRSRRFVYILLALSLLVFVSRSVLISMSLTRNSKYVADSYQTRSYSLFDKNSANFKPTTEITEITKQNCNPLPSKPLKTVRSFRQFKPCMNITQLTITKDDFETPLAVCELYHPYPGSKEFFTHFPHTMQALYMCYTYWQNNPSRIPVLYPYEKNRAMKAFRNNPFLKGIIESMESQMNLKILDGKEIQGWLNANATKPDTTGNGERNIVAGANGYNKINFTTVQMKLPGIGYVASHVGKLNEMVDRHFSIGEEITKPVGDENSTFCPPPRIGILNRKRSSSRCIENAEHLVHEIVSVDFAGTSNQSATIPLSSLPPVVSLKYFEDSSFEEQVRFFHSIDVLISPHGAQLTGIPFMANKPCTHLIEFFPHNYLIPDFFGTLARDSGIKYSYIYVSSSSAEEIEQSSRHGRIIGATRQQRSQNRRRNFCIDPRIMVDAVRDSIRNWCVCKKSLDRTNQM